MAAGEGRRMRPLTDRWPKPILPIDGRPVVATLVRELALAGCTRVTVVIGHLGSRITALLGDGAAFGLPVRYAEQPEPLGSADAVRRALAEGVEPPFLVTAADTVYAPGDIARARERWEKEEAAAAALAVRDVLPDDVEGRATVTVAGDRLVSIGGAAQERGARIVTAAPLWFFGSEIAAALADLPGPPYELADAVRGAIARGRTVLAIRLRPTRDVTRPEDVVTRNFPYLST